MTENNHSNLRLAFWLVIYLACTAPFLGKWCLVFPVGLFAWALIQCEKHDRSLRHGNRDS